MDDTEISYDGIDEAELLAALYRGTRPLGLGVIHDRADFGAADAREYIDRAVAVAGPDRVYFDYLVGRPLKLALDRKRKVIPSARLYDRDAGHGACAAIIARLRGGR